MASVCMWVCAAPTGGQPTRCRQLHRSKVLCAQGSARHMGCAWWASLEGLLGFGLPHPAACRHRCRRPPPAPSQMRSAHRTGTAAKPARTNNTRSTARSNSRTAARRGSGGGGAVHIEYFIVLHNISCPRVSASSVRTAPLLSAFVELELRSCA